MLVAGWIHAVLHLVAVLAILAHNVFHSNFQDIVISEWFAVPRLKLAQAKLVNDPPRAALKLLACLFSAEELVNGNPTGLTNSKDPHRQETIKKLGPQRMSSIHGTYIHTVFTVQFHLHAWCLASVAF